MNIKKLNKLVDKNKANLPSIRKQFEVGVHGAISGITVHMMFTIIFYFSDARLLVWLNLASVVFFGMIYYLNSLHKFSIAIKLTIIEVLIVNSVMIYCLGWNSGFAYYFLMIIFLPFLGYKPKYIFCFMFALFCLLLYVVLEYQFKEILPFYILNQRLLYALRVANLFIAFTAACSWLFRFGFYSHKIEQRLERETEKSRLLLESIFPEHIIEKINKGEKKIASKIELTSVLFLDLSGFTVYSIKKTPEELLEMLNTFFNLCDTLCEKYGLEKIKTIGDSYMIASGTNETKDDDAKRTVLFGLELIDIFNRHQLFQNENLAIRLGIHSGEVIAGIIGDQKPAFDLWGLTVNVASRIESTGIANRVQVSQDTYNLVKEDFEVEREQRVQAKGVGELKTYVLKPMEFKPMKFPV